MSEEFKFDKEKIEEFLKDKEYDDYTSSCILPNKDNDDEESESK